MLFVYIITACVILPYWYRKRCGSRRFWITLIAYLLLISMFFAFLSLWVIWTPSITNLTYHDGEYQGTPPLNKLSYPFSSACITLHIYTLDAIRATLA